MIEFDAASGGLRLDAGEFLDLVAWCEEPAGADPSPFEAAGVIVGGALDSRLAPGMAAVSEPVCLLDVTVAGAQQVEVHQGWLGESAAFLTQVTPHCYQFMTVGTQFAYAGLARLTRLGPRPRLADGRAGVPDGIWDQLSDLDADTRHRAARVLAEAVRPLWPAVADALAGREWSMWIASCTWQGADGQEAGRTVVVLDTLAGLLALGPDDARPGDPEAALLEPVTPTWCWQRLTGLLPGDDELPTDALPADQPLTEPVQPAGQ